MWALWTDREDRRPRNAPTESRVCTRRSTRPDTHIIAFYAHTRPPLPPRFPGRAWTNSGKRFHLSLIKGSNEKSISLTNRR